MVGAQSSSELRGDYTRARADFTVEQGWQSYTDVDRWLWQRLHARQMRLLPRYACAEFIAGVERMGSATTIPDLGVVSEALHAATRWRLVAVPGFIPDAVFFAHLAARQFPVTVWLRRPDEFDYLVEPDLFHDFFGHVPMLFNPVFADYMQRYGEQGLRAMPLGALPRMARLYWYTVEFGLIEREGRLLAYGAGILSSGGETVHAVESPAPLRVRFERDRCMRTRYRIDAYQKTYFVVRSLDELAGALADELDGHWQRLASLDDLDPERLHPGDEAVSIGVRKNAA